MELGDLVNLVAPRVARDWTFLARVLISPVDSADFGIEDVRGRYKAEGLKEFAHQIIYKWSNAYPGQDKQQRLIHALHCIDMRGILAEGNFGMYYNPGHKS